MLGEIPFDEIKITHSLPHPANVNKKHMLFERAASLKIQWHQDF